MEVAFQFITRKSRRQLFGMRKYEAVIFDMDGVLVNSEPFDFEAINKVLAPLGHKVGQALYKSILGYSDQDGWSILIEHFALNGNIDDYIAQNHEALFEVFAQPHEPLPGACGLLADLARRQTSFGLATSAAEKVAEALLRSVGLRDHFGEIAHADLVNHAKPAPDLYLKAAEIIGVAPERCIAVEDSPPGIASAKAAGMYAVQVRASSFAYPPQPEADLVIETLDDFPMHLLDGKR